MNLKPNPEFLKVDPAARKKWHDALLSTEHPQGRGAMVVPSGVDGVPDAWCCLMVGHDAFGGTDSNHGPLSPNNGSPFVKAMGNSVPKIGLLAGKEIWADGVNDDYGYTFPQIAQLVYPEAYEVQS